MYWRWKCWPADPKLLILRGVGLADPATTGGLHQKVSDNPPLTAQWPHKKVWLATNGHWAYYDDLSVEQFVQGYLEIILPTIPIEPATAVARDHLLYLQTMMRDTASSPWHLVRSTHKQILLMVEHKQLKWEDTTNRNSIRTAQLLLAKEEALQDKFLGLPDKQVSAKPVKRKPVKEEVGKTCPAFQTGACAHPKSHNLDGTNLLHVCSYCYKHGGHRFSHQETSCQRKVKKSSWTSHHLRDSHSIVRSRSSNPSDDLALSDLSTAPDTPSTFTSSEPVVTAASNPTSAPSSPQDHHGPMGPPPPYALCGSPSDLQHPWQHNPWLPAPMNFKASEILPPPASCSPIPAPDPWTTPLQDHHPDSELYWCPWLDSELIIPDHPRPHMDTCALPPHPHCPGPLLDFAEPPVTRPAAAQALQASSPQLALIYKAVKSLGLPKYRWARQPIPHNINIPAWRQRSHLFNDPSLIEMLEFGFPIGYTASHPLAPYTGNHPSATQYLQDIQKELHHSVILGPFSTHPFNWPRSNPMMTRPKKDSLDRRVIVDLSMPQGASVNSGIPKTSLDGAPFKLRLPNPVILAHKILQYGSVCLLYKVDLSRAYRQLQTDPLDWPFLMLHWEDQFYLDISIPIGLRHGASACQRTTEAVSAIAREEIGAHRHHLPQPSRQSRPQLAHPVPGPVEWDHPHQAFRSPARHPCGLMLAGRWRPLLRIGVLQAPLPRLPPGPRPLHLQPGMLEPPCCRTALASCPPRLYSPHLLWQLGHSCLHQLSQSHGPHHQRLPPGALVDRSYARRPARSQAQARGQDASSWHPLQGSPLSSHSPQVWTFRPGSPRARSPATPHSPPSPISFQRPTSHFFVCFTLSLIHVLYHWRLSSRGPKGSSPS